MHVFTKIFMVNVSPVKSPTVDSSWIDPKRNDWVNRIEAGKLYVDNSCTFRDVSNHLCAIGLKRSPNSEITCQWKHVYGCIFHRLFNISFAMPPPLDRSELVNQSRMFRWLRTFVINPFIHIDEKAKSQYNLQLRTGFYV